VDLVTVDALVARIDATLAADPALPARGAAIAFDGDGTLWRGDVGDDFFLETVERNDYRPAAVEGMRAVGRAAGLDCAEDEDPARLAGGLFGAYLRHELAEDVMCEVIAWACAGWSVDEVNALAREVVADLGSRRHPEVAAVVGWARARGLETFLVSASPRPVVEAAGAGSGFDREHIIATTAPFTPDGVMLPSVIRPIPYGPGKASLLDAHLGGRALVAAFGDNVFDVPMLMASRVPVVVEPKPRLVARLAELPDFHPVSLRIAGAQARG
jgi:HAD superfamily phosphoserine phosphatase-like hydrolase